MKPTFFKAIQADICSTIQAHEPHAQFQRDAWERPALGSGLSSVMEEGAVFEKAGVNYSHVTGMALPPSATERHPELAHSPFSAMGVSVVIHPRNPYVPTSHFNVRLLEAGSTWWVGGGFDLTPYYADEADCIVWHQAAKAACDRHDPTFYARFKAQCDAYFFLKHRNEARGIGGIFFDDLTFPSQEAALAYLRDVTDAYCSAYSEIVERQKSQKFGDRERAFQAWRRGRYVEFNLIYDRGTLFGLQSNGRAESILMSLPPRVEWHYQDHVEPGTPESALLTHFLPARDWLALAK